MYRFPMQSIILRFKQKKHKSNLNGSGDGSSGVKVSSVELDGARLPIISQCAITTNAQ